jgi:hypothetical protein
MEVYKRTYLPGRDDLEISLEWFSGKAEEFCQRFQDFDPSH